MFSLLWFVCFFFSSRRRHTRCSRDWSSDVCSSDLFIASVCRNRRPFDCCPSFVFMTRPLFMSSTAVETISSRKRLACRALRETSERPRLCWSSSSSVAIGRYRSCSSKRNRLVGACISTLGSRTNSFFTFRFRGGGRRFRGTKGGEGGGSSCGGRSASIGFWQNQYPPGRVRV